MGRSDHAGSESAGADIAVSSSAVRSSKARPSRSRPAWSRRAISRSSGESISVGQLGELGRVEVAQVEALPIELKLHPQGGLAQLGVGLGGTAEDQALIAAGQAVLVVGVVQAKADECGSESAGPWAGLLHQRHRAEGLSHGRCRS